MNTLEAKFDETIHYLQALKEENVSLKYSISQLQLQEDMQNRERRQNLRIRGVSEKVSDNNIRSLLLGLFNSLAPDIADIDWRMDRAHRSLAPKLLVGARPHDFMVRFHYYESKEALTLAARNRSHIDYKGDRIQIFSDLSLITLANRYSLQTITSYLQQHKIPYY